MTDIDARRTDTDWILDALCDFGRVSEKLVLENEGRLLQALISKVRGNEGRRSSAIDLVRLTDATGTQEAA